LGRRFGLSKDVDVMLTMSDYSRLEIPNLNDSRAKREFYGRVKNWTDAVEIDLTNEQISKILTLPIRTIHIQANKQNFDFDLKLKESDVIKKMLVLVLNQKKNN
jgi:hypothetical protein